MTILFWLYKSRAAATGEVPIMMRITAESKRVSFSTNLSTDPKSWDQPRQRIKGSSPLVKEMNNTLANFSSAALAAYNDYTKKGLPVDPESIRNTILRKNKSATTLLEAFAYQIDNLRARVGHDISANTIKKYETMERKVRAFLSAQNRTDIYLPELNFRFISELDIFLISKGGLKPNAVAKNMQQLKRLIKVCINLGWIEKDPFANYSCRLSETDRGYLTADELTVIEEVNLPNKRLEQVRDVFVFCCYTGLAYVDVSKLGRENFEKGSNGMDWIKINRTKTKTRALIPLLPKARQKLDKYAGSSAVLKGRLLPVISNQNLNKYLKEIAALCSIQKRVSMHLARHTFATTVTLEKGVDISTVSKMLGHKNVKTTQIYSKVTELKIAADIAKLM